MAYLTKAASACFRFTSDSPANMFRPVSQDPASWRQVTDEGEEHKHWSGLTTNLFLDTSFLILWHRTAFFLNQTPKPHVKDWVPPQLCLDPCEPSDSSEALEPLPSHALVFARLVEWTDGLRELGMGPERDRLSPGLLRAKGDEQQTKNKYWNFRTRRLLWSVKQGEEVRVMETVEWNAVLPQAPICCLGPRQLKETSHSPILTGPHVTAQGKMKMPAPCLKSIEFQDHESRELNQAQRPAHLHRPPTTTPPRLRGTLPHSCWAQFSHQNVPLLLLPREALPVCLYVSGGCQTSWAQILYSHTARQPPPWPPGTRPAWALPQKPVHFQVISDYPSSLIQPLLISHSPLLRTCCSSVLQLATGLGQWTPLMLVFGFAFRTSGHNPPSAPEGESSGGRPHWKYGCKEPASLSTRETLSWRCCCGNIHWAL